MKVEMDEDHYWVLFAPPAEGRYWNPGADSPVPIGSVSTKKDAVKAAHVDAKFLSWARSIRMSMDETGEVSSVS